MNRDASLDRGGRDARGPRGGVRLLYVGGFELPTAQARGIQTLHTAHALARAGWRVRLLAQRPPKSVDVADSAGLGAYGLSPHPRLRVISLPVLRLGGVPRVDIHARLALTNWSYGLACLADLMRLRRRADLIFTRDPRLAWIFIKTRRLHGCPVVYEVHEVFSTRPRDNQSLELGEIRGVAGRTRDLERTVFSGADLLLPLTRTCADLLRDEYGVVESRLVVVPDGTTAPRGDVAPRESASRTVVYAGQLYPWKGVDTLLEAMKAVPSARLTILGGLGPDDPNLAACRALANRSGIAERVDFAGFVPHGEVRSRLTGAGAGVVPLPDRLMSRYFTSPLKLFDYMAAGVPLVASDLPALREVLADGENALLVPPGDAGALARAISRLLDDAALAERLRRRALADVADYTWARRAERIIEAAELLVRS